MEWKTVYQEKLVHLQSLNDAFNQSTIVAITDASGLITYVNDKFCEISGYRAGRINGENTPND
ncbi:PAS domain S-box protein [Ammoniphilus sp. YIM 78166]|uniref:PAS domain S-box protein n=1 Tax=Ammoniphilus sp. YIM 78166 TaxID=1644106 RepID=UPI001F0F155E|nr:PAS domain S-box protein [Ammoniphilus sp. YIM 78166]